MKNEEAEHSNEEENLTNDGNDCSIGGAKDAVVGVDDRGECKCRELKEQRNSFVVCPAPTEV